MTITMRISVDGLKPLDEPELAASIVPCIGASFRLTFRPLAGLPVLWRAPANLRSVAALRKTHNHPTRFPRWIVIRLRKNLAETDICLRIATDSLRKTRRPRVPSRTA